MRFIASRWSANKVLNQRNNYKHLNEEMAFIAGFNQVFASQFQLQSPIPVEARLRFYPLR